MGYGMMMSAKQEAEKAVSRKKKIHDVVV